MINLIAIGLLAIFIGFTAVAFLKKSVILSLLASILWIIWVVYEYDLSAGVWDMNRNFALFGTLMAICCWILPYTWREKHEDGNKRYDSYEDIYDHIEQDHKPKQESEETSGEI